MNHTRTTGRGIIRCTATAILTLAAPFGLTACSLFESMDTGTPDTSASGAFEETNTTETSTIGTSSMEGGTTTATPTPNQNTLPPNASDQYFIDLASEYLTTEQDYRQDNDNADALRTLMCDGGLTQLTFDLTAFSGIDAPNPNDPSSAFNEGDVSRRTIDGQEAVSVYGQSANNKRFRIDFKEESNGGTTPDSSYCVENTTYVDQNETSPSYLPPIGNG